MDEEQAEFMNQQIGTAQLQNMQQQQAQYIDEQNAGIIKEQLDLTEELNTMEHLLRSHVLTTLEDGDRVWKTPEDSKMIVLTEYGVQLVLHTLNFYLNKNTLLSNYDEKTIDSKMEDFSTSLCDTVFMEYDEVFCYPTFEDCKKILNERVERRKDLKVYAKEILGEKIKEGEAEEIKVNMLKEIEPIIGKELEKIKEQLMKNKLKRFDLLMRQIQDAVHSCYLRAWRGQERTTLRQHISISETKGFTPQAPVQEGGFHFFRKRK